MIVRLADSAPPLTPDGAQGRQWAVQELRDPAYAAAQPTPLDRMARAVQEFFVTLFSGRAEGAWAVWLALAVAVVLIALIVVAIVLSGLSRGSRPAAELFGDIETRSAAQLRRAASDAAAVRDWSRAVILRQRALARGLLERGAIELVPGATVHAFARAAASVFPSRATLLDAAADAFDDVRYLRREGTAAMYEAVVRADDAVQADRPARDEPAMGAVR